MTFGTSCVQYSRLSLLQHNGASTRWGCGNDNHPCPLAQSSAITICCLRCTGLRAVGSFDRHADPADVDAKFLAALSSKGITYTSPEVMIAAGQVACTELDRGEAPAQVAQDVMNNKDVLTSSNLDAFHAGFFVGASIAAYCPKYVGRI